MYSVKEGKTPRIEKVSLVYYLHHNVYLDNSPTGD